MSTPYTALFDRGPTSAFFDQSIFDTSFHYVEGNLTESVPVSDSVSFRGTFLRTIFEGGYFLFDPTGGMFDANIFDTSQHQNLTVSDSVNSAFVSFRNINEPSISDSDSLSSVQSLTRLLNENISVSDTLTRKSMLVRLILDGVVILFDPTNGMFDLNIFDTKSREILNVSDQVSGTQNLERTLNETSVAVSDSLSRVQTLLRTIMITPILVSDLLSRVASYTRTLNEPNINVTDQLNRMTTNFRTISETPISVSDTASEAIIYARTIVESAVNVFDIVTGTLPPGSIRFISRIKLILDITSNIKQTLTANSSII